MNRRGFIGTILALGAAPAIVRADSLMRIVPRNSLVIAANPPFNIDITPYIRETRFIDIFQNLVVLRFDVFDGIKQIRTQVKLSADTYPTYVSGAREVAHAELKLAVTETGGFGTPIYLPESRNRESR